MRGSTTLPLRPQRRCENAMAVAEFRDGDTRVVHVSYPGLPGHDQHEAAVAQLAGGFGGVMPFAVGGSHAERLTFVNDLRAITSAVSLGHDETLVAYEEYPEGPAKAFAEPFRDHGLVRLAIGLEAGQDFIVDLDTSLTTAYGPAEDGQLIPAAAAPATPFENPTKDPRAPHRTPGAPVNTTQPHTDSHSLTGLSAFPLTPINNDADGTIDETAFRNLIARLAAASVDSITILGSTGSYAYLTADERRRVVELTIDAAGVVPVLVGVGATRTRDVLSLAEHAQQSGAAGLLVAPVSYQPLSDGRRDQRLTNDER